MSRVSSTRLPTALSTWSSSSSLPATLITPQSRIVLRRPSFASEYHPEEPVSLPPSVSAAHAPQPPLAYAPFPTCSINLISCASNSGKTQFLTQVIQQRHKFFQDWQNIRRIIYLNGNLRDTSLRHPWSDRPLELEVVSLTLEEFKDPIASVSPFDVIIIDDLLTVSSEVDYLCKYLTHHSQLYLFLVCQSCIKSPLYSLLRLTHSLVLLFGNSATSRLAQHLVTSFFLCSETKTYLKAILSIAERQQDIVLLKINAVASYRPHLDVLALSRVQQLFDSSWPHCFVYPELGRTDNLWKDMETAEPVGEIPPLSGDYLEQAFVLVPVHRLQQRSLVESVDHEKDSTKNDCLKEKEKMWNDMGIFLENEITRSFPSKRWQAAKNLGRELLRCSGLCITSNFKMVHPPNKPRQQYSIIDFLQVASRRSGPNEKMSEKVMKYKPLVNILLQHQVPESYILNKHLLEEFSPRRQSHYPKLYPHARRRHVAKRHRDPYYSSFEDDEY